MNAARPYQQDVEIRRLNAAYPANRRSVIELYMRAKLPRISHEPAVLFRLFDGVGAESHTEHDWCAVFSNEDRFNVRMTRLKLVGDIDATGQIQHEQADERKLHHSGSFRENCTRESERLLGWEGLCQLSCFSQMSRTKVIHGVERTWNIKE